MIVKQGVILPSRAEIWPAIVKAEAVYMAHGRPEGTTITSGEDGRHSHTSKHYAGDAVDLRTRYFTAEVAREVARELSAAAGPNYDVILEDTHIHMEYHPKRGASA